MPWRGLALGTLLAIALPARAAEAPARGPRTMPVRATALFRPTPGRIVACSAECPGAVEGEYPSGCAEAFASSWVFVLREDKGQWRVGPPVQGAVRGEHDGVVGQAR
jgi:hypothetical protein